MPRHKKTVDIIREVGQLNLTGNVIPHHWFKCITFDNQKPDLLAIMILGEIIYWYRPQAVKDEKTGCLLGIKKKFKADLLQRNAKSFANQFGCSLRQAQNALARLVLCDNYFGPPLRQADWST